MPGRLVRWLSAAEPAWDAVYADQLPRVYFSTVTNGVMALGFYGIAFVGGWIEQIGGFAGSQAAKTVGIVASLISPADALWRLASYQIQPESLRNFGAALFATSSVPTRLMVWWAAGFTVATLIFAVRSFSTRQL